MGRISGRLHKAAKSWPLSVLCERCDVSLDTGDPSQKIDTVSSPSAAVSGTLILLGNKAYIEGIAAIPGLVCLTSAELAPAIKEQLADATILIAARPRAAFARILREMFASPSSATQPEAGISELADIHPEAVIDPAAHIGAFVVIGRNCSVGAGTRIGAGTVLGEDVHLAAKCDIGAHNVLSHLHSGEGLKTGAHCVIGKRGFGFEGQGEATQFLLHLGRVVIGKGCDIGAGTTIDRGGLDDTVIGDYVQIDNLCHIAHNVVIENNVIILAQAGIAGSVVIGKNCIIGGQVGIGDHITLADNVVVASKSGVTKDLQKPGNYAGFPAMPAREFWLQMASARRKNTSSKT